MAVRRESISSPTAPRPSRRVEVQPRAETAGDVEQRIRLGGIEDDVGGQHDDRDERQPAGAHVVAQRPAQVESRPDLFGAAVLLLGPAQQQNRGELLIHLDAEPHVRRQGGALAVAEAPLVVDGDEREVEGAATQIEDQLGAHGGLVTQGGFGRRPPARE